MNGFHLVMEIFDSENPATGEAQARIPDCRDKDINKPVSKAKNYLLLRALIPNYDQPFLLFLHLMQLSLLQYTRQLLNKEK